MPPQRPVVRLNHQAHRVRVQNRDLKRRALLFHLGFRRMGVLKGTPPGVIRLIRTILGKGSDSAGKYQQRGRLQQTTVDGICGLE